MIWLFIFITCVYASEVDVNIIGGTEVPESNLDYRAIVSLQRKTNKGFKHSCGGTLVSPTWVMTAGHCVKYDAPERIRLGSYDNTKNGYVRKAKKVVRHPNYYSTTNDIALIKLDKAVNDIRPMSIDINGKFSKDGTVIKSIGWGYTKEGSGLTVQKLREVDLEILNHKECSKKYGGNAINEEAMLCTWGEWNKKTGQRNDACSGDSGSPNFFYNKDTHDTILVGITSWGRGCGRKDIPGVTTRVSTYTNWIKNIVTDMGKGDDVEITQAPTFKPTPEPTRIPDM